MGARQDDNFWGWLTPISIMTWIGLVVAKSDEKWPGHGLLAAGMALLACGVLLGGLLVLAMFRGVRK